MFSFIGILFSSTALMKNQTHTLNLLICLESLMLGLLVFTYSVCVFFGFSIYMFLIIITMAACEAAMGLSLLVSILRLRGSDFIKSFNSILFFAKFSSTKII
nr:NADH dehydrogenase subunit 4L [Runcina aurata]